MEPTELMVPKQISYITVFHLQVPFAELWKAYLSKELVQSWWFFTNPFGKYIHQVGSFP